MIIKRVLHHVHDVHRVSKEVAHYI